MKKTHKKPAFLEENSEDFLFNRSISKPALEKPAKKRKPVKKTFEDFEESPKKKLHSSEKSIFFDEETFFSSLQPNFSSFFLNNKSQLLSISRISGLKYPIGSYILGAVTDKGPNGAYLVLNLSRNKKAFVSKEDSSVNLSAFSLGEYVVGMVIMGRKGEIDSKNTQVSLRPAVLNGENSEFFENMVISATLISEEDHGWTFSLENEFLAFVKKKHCENEVFIKNKPFLLRIAETPKKKKLLVCEFAKNTENPLKKPKELNVDLKQFLMPGTLFSVKIAKKVENGLIVKFFGVIGFIYDEHLQDSLENYAVGTTILARSLFLDPKNKQIVLSCKENLLNLQVAKPKEAVLGKIYQGFLVIKRALGGCFWLKIEDFLVFLSKKQSGKLGESPESAENSKTEEILKNRIKIKDFNYLEGVYLGTLLEEFLDSKEKSWKELKSGDFITGQIASIKQNRLLISFNKSIKGVVDQCNFSDKPFKGFIKPKYKENKTIKARILTVDPVNKRIFLTIKPILMQENLEILDDLLKARPGEYFYGYISGENLYGYIVSFFNEIKGLLSFKTLEEVDKIEKSSLALGKTVKVYVTFVNIDKRKIGLSLTKPAKNVTGEKIMSFSYEKKFEEFLKKNEGFFEKKEKNEEVLLGEIFEYQLLKKPEDFPEEFLLLSSKKTEKKHQAVLYKDHLSDIISQNVRLLEVFEKSSKKETFQCVVIGKTGDFLIVSAKKSLVSQYHNYRTFPFSYTQLTPKTTYYCYVQKILSKGILVKFHEELLGFIPNSKIEGFSETNSEEKNQEIFNSTNFPLNKTMKILISKVKSPPQENFLAEKPRILCSALEKDTKFRDHPKEFSLMESFFEEEAFLAKSAKKKDLAEKIAIGDFLRAEITQIKQYGVIVKLINHDNFIGFILLENLIDDKTAYQKGFILQTQVLDLDFEKEIIDLKELRIPEEKFEKKVAKNCYNLKKIVKNTGFFKKNGQIFKEAKILLVKENFVIVRLKELKIIAILQARTVNEYKPTHEKFEINGVLPEISLENFAQISKIKRVESVDFSNKFGYIPVFSLISQKTHRVSDENTKEISKNQENLQIGQKIDAKIVKIQKNALLVQINQHQFLLGRIHFSQFDFEPLTHKSEAFSYKIGDRVPCKILRKSPLNPLKKHENMLELTCLKSHMDLEEFLLDSTIILPEIAEIEELLKNNQLKGRLFNAFVKSLAPLSINPIYLELSNTVYGSISAFSELVPPQNYEKLNNLQEYYHEGDIYPVFIKGIVQKADEKNRIFKSLQLSFLEKEQKFEYGDLVLVKIVKNLQNSLRAQISATVFASIDLLEICDEFQINPLIRYPIGHFLQARVISTILPENPLNSEAKSTNSSMKNTNSEGKNMNSIKVSLRETLTNERNWEILTKKSTLSYKKAFEEIENQGDLRCRILKLGVSSLKTGMIFLGYVHQTNDKGCFIKLSADTFARAKLSELSDENITNFELKFYRNRLVIGRILNILPDQKIEVSLRESVVKYGFPLELDKISKGITVEGVVCGYTGEKALIKIKGCRFLGSLNVNDSNLAEKAEEMLSINQILPLGLKVKAKVLNFQKEPKIRIKLGNRKDFFDDNDEDFAMEIDEKYAELWESIEEMNSDGKKMEIEVEEKKVEIEENIEEEELSTDDLKEILEEKQRENEENKEENDEEDEEEDEEDEEEEDDEDVEENKEGIEEEIDENNGENKEEIEEEKEKIAEKPKKKKKKKKENEFMEKELEIRKEERKFLENPENNPKSYDDYEKLLLKNPDSSYVWINYMAFLMEKKGIEEARNLAERSLKAMNFKTESEKLNIWIAYLNLENSFGTESALIKVFERAISSNDPKKVYLKLLEIYRRNQQFGLVVELAKKMIKKHKNSCKAWIELIRNLMFVKENTKEEGGLDVKETVKRALQSLQKKKHLKFLSHYARMEFMHGDAEKGRTTFEAIITNYPKR